MHLFHTRFKSINIFTDISLEVETYLYKNDNSTLLGVLVHNAHFLILSPKCVLMSEISFSNLSDMKYTSLVLKVQLQGTFIKCINM